MIMKTIYRIALVAMACLLVLTACSSPTPTPSPTQALTAPTNANASYPAPTAQGNPAYPAPGAATANPAYPGPSAKIPGYADPAYPAPATPTENPGTPVKVTPFKLDTPILEGATTVTGVGPAGIPIILVDVTLNGQILTKANVGSDGKFTFTVSSPLEKDHRLGIALGDLTGTPWVEKNFDDPGFQGSQPQLVPNVGFFYDTTMVQAK
jgi:hypothetical protein